MLLLKLSKKALITRFPQLHLSWMKANVLLLISRTKFRKLVKENMNITLIRKIYVLLFYWGPTSVTNIPAKLLGYKFLEVTPCWVYLIMRRFLDFFTEKEFNLLQGVCTKFLQKARFSWLNLLWYVCVKQFYALAAVSPIDSSSARRPIASPSDFRSSGASSCGPSYVTKRFDDVLFFFLFVATPLSVE